MSEVFFDEEQITIFGIVAPYDPYYFAVEGAHSGRDYREVIKDVFRQWADALAVGARQTKALYLPFGVYDQCVECFEAEFNGEKVALRRVWINVEAWSLNLNDLREFIGIDHKVAKPSDGKFGTFETSSLVSALRNARRTAA